MRNLILAVLDRRPGLPAAGIYAWLQEGVGTFWDLKDGAVRLVLDNAEKHKLIRGEEGKSTGRPQKVYYLTPAGEEALAEWNTETIAEHRAHRDELILRLLYGQNTAELHKYLEDREMLNATQAQTIQRRMRQGAPDGVNSEIWTLVLRAVADHDSADFDLLEGAGNILRKQKRPAKPKSNGTSSRGKGRGSA